MQRAARELLRHHDERLARFGDRPDDPERQTRFAVMLDILAAETAARVELLDFACGTGELFRLARTIEQPAVAYRGVDLSEAALSFARRKYPDGQFGRLDILAADDEQLRGLAADYCVINDLFTVKAGLGDAEMWDFMTAVLGRLWAFVRKAVAFNLMARQVDRQRSDLFPVSLDRIAEFLHGLAGPAVAFRADYGLDEYTCYVRKEPQARSVVLPAAAIEPPADAGMVCRPLLPGARRIAPYLAAIDRRRWYSNFGEAALALAGRLAAHFRLAEGHCVTAASGTAALTGALLAVAGRASDERPYCVMPSYTFVGTAAAVIAAGYRPYFVDVDPESWALDPDRLRHNPVLRRAGAIIVVAPYGQPIAQQGWQRLAAATGIPVVIDAAAGFDAIAAEPAATLGPLPVVLSLHATKVFAVGEGGLVLCSDAETLRRCARALNFGFLDSREALVAGFNGKMSEYHAAVGLAALDAWPRVRLAFVAVAEAYRRAAEAEELGVRIVAPAGWASTYVLYRAPSAAAAAAAAERLAAARIDFRLWYGAGCHRQPAYAGCARDALPVTEELAPRIIGLPVAIDLPTAVVEHVVTVLARQ